MISQNLIKDILSKVDIVDIIGNYVALTPRGKNFVGVCPFHDDKNPSMSVSKEKQYFKCFSCGESGNAISFVQKYNNIPFSEAVQIVAEQANVELPMNVTQVKHIVPETTLRTYQLNSELSKFSNYLLHQSEDSLIYLKERKIAPMMIDKFALGTITNSKQLTNYLEAKGFNDQEIRNSGLFFSDGNFKWINRLLIPIRDPNGNIAGFSARTMKNEQAVKYINSDESDVFKKGKLLYNLDSAYQEARKSNKLYLMEGYFDVIKASQNGINNAVATLGTALTDGHIKLLQRLKVNVVLCFDGDAAGIKATTKNYYLLKNAGIKPNIILLPDKMDPDEMMNRDIEQFKTLLNGNKNFLDFTLQQYDPSESFDEQEKFILTFLKCLSDEENKLANDYYLKRLSEITGYSQQTLKEQLAIIKPEVTPEQKLKEQQFKIKIDKKAPIPESVYPKKGKIFVNFKTKPKLTYMEEIKTNYDSKKENVVAFDKYKLFERKDVLEKYVTHKGIVLETLITFANFEHVNEHAQYVCERVMEELSSTLDIQRDNLDFIGYLHTDTKQPHIHIQSWQKEPYLDKYKLSSALVKNLEATIEKEMLMEQTNEVEIIGVKL